MSRYMFLTMLSWLEQITELSDVHQNQQQGPVPLQGVTKLKNIYMESKTILLYCQEAELHLDLLPWTLWLALLLVLGYIWQFQTLFQSTHQLVWANKH